MFGDSYADAKQHCDELQQTTGLVLVPPFDDPLVIAGQGTIGDELLRQSHRSLDAVFVAVGGGGLITGIAGYIKALMPGVRIIGVEPFEADAMYQSLAAGRRVRLEHVGIFADGVAVREVGRSRSSWRGRRWTRSSGSATMRSVPRSKTSSTTPAA